MFSLKNEGKEYEVTFKYDRKADRTYCSILEGETVIASGNVRKCHLDGWFKKNEGRKKAMTKALENSKFSKELRTLFWKAYFQVRHGKTN